MPMFPPSPADRLLPVLIAAIVFLAALAGAGGVAAAGLARQWRGAASGATIQVPESEAGAAAASLGPAAHRLTPAELAAALRPWLGAEAARLTASLPAVFELAGTVPPALIRAAPDAIISNDTVWQARLAGMARSLRACAGLAAAAVAFVAAGIVALATGASLSARRDAIGIVHHLGATDGLIAGRLAGQTSLLAFAGAAAGAILSAGVLRGLAGVAAPFQPPGLAAALPLTLWVWLAALPLLAALIGWLTAQATVRSWLRRLP